MLSNRLNSINFTINSIFINDNRYIVLLTHYDKDGLRFLIDMSNLDFKTFYMKLTGTAPHDERLFKLQFSPITEIELMSMNERFAGIVRCRRQQR